MRHIRNMELLVHRMLQDGMDQIGEISREIFALMFRSSVRNTGVYYE